jgi:hypothetical protein
MTDVKTTRFRFFLPRARAMERDEIASLPPEKLEDAESDSQQGVWLEMACPDESCIDDESNLTISAKGIEMSGKKGTFLNLFCPENPDRKPPQQLPA